LVVIRGNVAQAFTACGSYFFGIKGPAADIDAENPSSKTSKNKD
jgi:hypothetical protein